MSFDMAHKNKACCLFSTNCMIQRNFLNHVYKLLDTLKFGRHMYILLQDDAVHLVSALLPVKQIQS